MLFQDAMVQIESPLTLAGSAGFDIDGEERDVWNCFSVVLFNWTNIPESRQMAFLKHGIVVMRPLYNIWWLQRIFVTNRKWLWASKAENLARGECAWLMTNAGSMGKKHVYWEKRHLAEAAEEKLSMQSLLKWGSRLELAGIRMQDTVLTCMHC